MEISVDNLNDLPAVKAFFESIKKELLIDGTAIKTVKVFAAFNSGSQRNTYKNSDSRPLLLLPLPKTDLETFDYMKKMIAAPADEDDEDEKGLSPEELQKQRDPEGIRHMSLESKPVQKAIAFMRREMAKQPIDLIKEVFEDILSDLKDDYKNRPVELTELKVTVIHRDEKDPSKQLKSKFKAQLENPSSIAGS
jgi:hypothetical protein